MFEMKKTGKNITTIEKHKPTALKALKHLLLVVMLCNLSHQHTSAQETYKLQELFMNAESWFYFQDYKNSLPLYLRVHQAYPENDNINYKIGFCYLNMDGQKHKAIPYLKNAANNTTFNFSEEAFYEKQAPVDAIFYLANAYLIDNQIDKALETYNRFEEKVKNHRGIFRRKNFDYEYLQHQKEKCKIAKELMSEPIDFTAEKLGLPVNTPQSEYNPVVSGDGRTMVFTADKKFYTGVFMVKKKNGQWGPPINLLPQLGIDGDCQTTSLSYDGTELYLYREDELDGNIYVSYYENGKWTNIQKLGENINTKYWESHAFISSDGQELYFTSNREGGYGDLDIYKAKRNGNGTWKKPENIGKPINTEWRENTPFLTEDGKTLFFSSGGHYNMGGYDIFVSHKTPDGWSDPQNIGYPINTTDDDQFMVPIEKGKKAYYAKYNKKAAGQKDIFKYNLKDLPTIDFIKVEGIMTYRSPENKVRQDFTINIINTQTNDTLATLDPSKADAEYSYKTPDGENHLIYETPVLGNNKQYLISKDYQIKEQFLEPKKLAEKTEKEQEPQINLEKDVFKAQSKQDNIKIKLQLKGGNKLVVNTFQGGKLVNSEEFSIEKDSFIYEYQPDEKESRLTFNLFRDEKSILSKDVNIVLDSISREKALADTDTKLQIKEKNVSFDSGKKKIKIKLSLDKGSRLFVETFVDNQLINTEEFDIQHEDFTYEFEPREEKSKINFKVIDQNDNIKNQEIVISHKPIQPGLELLLKSINQYGALPIAAMAGSFVLDQMTTPELLDSIKSQYSKVKGKQKGFDIFLMSATLLNAKNARDLYYDLHKLGNESIRQYLDQYDISKLTNKQDVIAILNKGVREGEISTADLSKLYNDYIIQNYKPEKLMALFENMTSINLNNLLSNIGTGALDIVSIDDLMKQINNSESDKKQEILAYLESLKIINEQYKVPAKEKITAPKEIAKKEPEGKNIFKYLLGGATGIILLVFIIFLIRRRNKNNSKS
jgi:hypothetical protein